MACNPKQTPNILLLAPYFFISSGIIPASLGNPGPGDKRILSYLFTSSKEILSFLMTSNEISLTFQLNEQDCK